MGSLGRRSWSAVLLAAALTLTGCQTEASPAPDTSAKPGPADSPDIPAAADAGPSSQALIAADLEGGAIDAGTALQYRAWALFQDGRLPEKYAGAPSSGEDNGLFDEIAATADTLPAEQSAELRRYLLRPTDAASPWSRPATAAVGVQLAAAHVAAASELQLCTAPNEWQHADWSPDGTADRGFRVWACGPKNDAAVRSDLDAMITIGSRDWAGMTYPEPDGMGLPMPDLGALQNDGNGKVDVYLLDSRAECRIRGSCSEIPSGGVAAAVEDRSSCAVTGFPEHGCSGYMLLARGRLHPVDAGPGIDPEFVADFVHEFFHVLQMAHNSVADLTWYHEASAVWAEFAFERAAAEDEAYAWFGVYQAENRSLLEYDYGKYVQYEAWAWPLFQSVEEGPSNVFQTWVAAEDAVTRADFDASLDEQLAFSSEFRNFMVRNAQPEAYLFGSSTGLDTDRWQTKDDLASFPRDAHALSHERSTLSLGKAEYPAHIDPLSAAFDTYEVVGKEIRQIEIDISKLTNAGNADLDVLAQIRSSSADTWTRFTGTGGKVKLCRDTAAEDVNTVLAVVISNHSFARNGNGPDLNQEVRGNYTIESKNKCDKRDLHLGGRITWNATTTERLGFPESVSGSADVVIHVVTSSLLVAERDDHSTYNYEYTSVEDPPRCPVSVESGTLESGGGTSGGAPTDYSIGKLNVGGRLGEDLYLDITMFDYCGPARFGDVGTDYYAFQGFPECALNGQVVAKFDGKENYVIDCDVIGWGGGSAAASGHISGVLRIIDGPHPTPRR